MQGLSKLSEPQKEIMLNVKTLAVCFHSDCANTVVQFVSRQRSFRKSRLQFEFKAENHVKVMLKEMCSSLSE